MGRHHRAQTTSWKHLALGVAVAATAGGAGTMVHVLDAPVALAASVASAAVTPVVMPPVATPPVVSVAHHAPAG